MIELDSVSHRYGARYALREISLALGERRVAIVGANGSGKSTFARLLNGLIVPTQGRVLVGGLDTRSEPRRVRRKVGFVFQNPDNQIVLPTVEEDIAFGMKNFGFDKRTIRERTEEVLRRYDLEGHRHHPCHLLSGGQKQLLALSGVLAMRPEYVVLDEPTTLLDLRNRIRIGRAIGELEQRAIVVTHDLELIADFERVIVFDEGRVLIDDAPEPALARYVEAMRRDA